MCPSIIFGDWFHWLPKVQYNGYTAMGHFGCWNFPLEDDKASTVFAVETQNKD